MLDECLSGGDGCPTFEEALEFIQKETGFAPDDETLELINHCAGSILEQLGF